MTTTPKTADGIGGRPGGPPLIDGNVVQWWAWKDVARDGARAIGWPVKSATAVMTRFQYGYALVQQYGGYLTKSEYARLLADRSTSLPTR